jgi:RNA polymerase sigma-70 factor (ECF subfamily)
MMGNVAENAELLSRIETGDVEAEEVLWNKYKEKVRYAIRRKMGWREDAQDLEQEVYLGFQKAAREGRLKNPGHLGAFIARICANKVADYFEARSKVVSLENSREPRADDNPEDDVVDLEEREQLDSAFEELGWLDQKILTLRYVEGWPHAKIAVFLGLSEANVRKRASRSVARLKRIVGNEPENV